MQQNAFGSMIHFMEWLAAFTKPFSNIFDPLTQRIGKWLGRRKPRLFVHFNPAQTHWGIGKYGSEDVMNAFFWADFTHDEDAQSIIITDAYPEGTVPQLALVTKIIIPPRQLVAANITAFVTPIVGQVGKPWIGRFILVDQFHRKYKTNKVQFRWVGNPPKSS